ncbi:uncharacterized protein IUM83_11897 [Phytophthora cinnamomi]|uniref:uncharacterized protein n=1 Tax=Phytophthora cinnamomi TaxID=4785 RepID=UPI00355A8FAB|nr:hypothetical protein IUM83_11897 [Phytophthora cinnamomi]
MSAPQKKSSKSVGSHLSIDDDFERQKAKYGDFVDFDDDDEDMEGEENSPSKRKDSVSSESLDPHAKDIRPREGDESDASRSKRSRTESDTPLASGGALSTPRAAAAARDIKAQGSPRAAPAARDPWMPSASEISDRNGNSVPPNEVPLYPRADQYAPLHDRVTAVERLQGAEFAALKQELANQKAQVAAVCETASNIQVELGTQMKGLLQRVRALEERLLVAEAKSSASASAPAEASGQPSYMARAAGMASAVRRKRSDGGAC